MITNDVTDFSNCHFLSGETILIDKPFRWTSFKVIHQIRKATGVQKVGHAGTLDPLATGLLIVCTGKKTKEIYKYQDLEKTYTGIITLGKSSPSMDLETPITEEKNWEHLTEEKILAERNKFIGEILQIPPMYSAIKYKGKSLYKFARKGKTINREPRKVQISKFEISKIQLPDLYFEISCSKGTYIRVVADDLGRNLGCGAMLSSLKRIKIGDYKIENAFSMDEFYRKASLCNVDGI
jgi:tRNA pseudouridine55 synthase